MFTQRNTFHTRVSLIRIKLNAETLINIALTCFKLPSVYGDQ